MEYIDGETLSDYLATSPSVRERKRILNELLDAVEFIHSHQVVHNDLKPDNILITRNGHNVKLIDFGYADGDFSTDKATGGTKEYASPELLERNETDAQSDIYSIGFIIKVLFPHRYKLILRKCQRENAKKRYPKVADIGKAMHHRDSGLRLSVAAVILCAILVGIMWQGNKERLETNTPNEVQIVQMTEPDLPKVDTVFVQVPEVKPVEQHLNPTPKQEDKTVSVESKNLKSDKRKNTLRPVFYNGSDDNADETEQENADKALNFPSEGKNSVVNELEDEAPPLDYKMIHERYNSVYEKHKRILNSAANRGKIKYSEFAVPYWYRFEEDLIKQWKEMMPEDEYRKYEFEADFMFEYPKLYQKLFGEYRNLPSFYDVVTDSAQILKLEKQLDKELTEEQKKRGQAANGMHYYRRLPIRI